MGTKYSIHQGTDSGLVLLPELRIGFITRFSGHKAAGSFHRGRDLVVMPYTEVLKYLAEVGGL
jgi:hypothetical protein